jgi:hypothetical protein
LKALQRRLGADAETAVERRRGEAVPGEEELERGDVPARCTAGQRPAAEQIAAVAAEGLARRRVADAGSGEAGADLETLHRGRRRGPSDPVDGAAVEAARVEAYLQGGDSSVARRYRRGRKGEGGDNGQDRSKSGPVGTHTVLCVSVR